MKIGIDIGVSKILGIVFSKQKILKEEKTETPKNKKEFLEVLFNLIRKLKETQKIKGIGVSICGVVFSDQIIRVPNLEYLEGLPLKIFLRRQFKTEIKLDNDLNCFLRCEKELGIFKYKKNALLIGLGSGLGGAILINKEIYQGSFASSGEFGHLIFNLNEKNFIEVEELLSQKWFLKNNFGTPQEVFEKAKNGDKKAKEIFKTYGKNLGILIANLINAFDPEIVGLCGGISNAWEFFSKEAEETAKKLIISPVSRRKLKISVARFKEKGASIGAALLIKN